MHQHILSDYVNQQASYPEDKTQILKNTNFKTHIPISLCSHNIVFITILYKCVSLVFIQHIQTFNLISLDLYWRFVAKGLFLNIN
jgi:hypothetical protein